MNAPPEGAGANAIREQAAILSARGLTKYYGSVKALQNVDFDLWPGEVLAVVGDNGAGKSTLMNCLAGAIHPDSGQIQVEGHEVRFNSPHQAQVFGIAAVYQDLALVDQRDVATNIFLGREPVGPFHLVRKAYMLHESEIILANMKIQLSSVNALVGTLSGGQRQVIAIARAIGFGGRIVLMDEPTAALGVQESGTVLGLIGRLAANGVGVAVISHNLEHVRFAADKVCVMRQGRVVGVRNMRETDDSEIVSMIMGTTGAIRPA